MSDDMVKRLLHRSHPVHIEAADLIQSQAARIERMEAALQTFCCGDETMQNILWADVSPDDLVTIRVKHSAYRTARAALKENQS